MTPAQAAPRRRRATALAVALALVPALPARAQAPVQDVELRDTGELLQGDQPLSRRDFFLMAGRLDLVERSDRNRTARWWLTGSAVAVLVAAGVVGSIILAMTPDLDKPWCSLSIPNLETCQSYHLLYQRGGVITIAAGAAVAALLATIGRWTNPDVLSTRDLAPLVERYNQEHAVLPP